jgi:hypothetical protein
MNYKSLSDAALEVSNPVYGKGTTKVWYARDNFFRDSLMGYDWLKDQLMLPDTKNLGKHYVLVGCVDIDTPEKVYEAMQGECWSPKGQASSFILSLGIRRTSMSVGDIIEKNGEFFLVDSFGFKRL